MSQKGNTHISSNVELPIFYLLITTEQQGKLLPVCYGKYISLPATPIQEEVESLKKKAWGEGG